MFDYYLRALEMVHAEADGIKVFVVWFGRTIYVLYVR